MPFLHSIFREFLQYLNKNLQILLGNSKNCLYNPSGFSCNVRIPKSLGPHTHPNNTHPEPRKLSEISQFLFPGLNYLHKFQDLHYIKALART